MFSAFIDTVQQSDVISKELGMEENRVRGVLLSLAVDGIEYGILDSKNERLGWEI
jgi:hypothetical protein